MYAVAILILGLVASITEGCNLFQPVRDPNWATLKKDWYNLLSMPGSGGGTVDCYQWLNITGDANGFFVTIGVSVEGYPVYTYRDRFVKKRTGVYVMSGDYVDDFIATVKAANAHQLDEKLEETIAADAAWMVNREIAILTKDGNDHMTFTMCSDWGTVTWILLPSTKAPTVDEMVTLWNDVYADGLMNSVHYNKQCATE